jgi:hypothetical protein
MRWREYPILTFSDAPRDGRLDQPAPAIARMRSLMPQVYACAGCRSRRSGYEQSWLRNDKNTGDYHFIVKVAPIYGQAIFQAKVRVTSLILGGDGL